LSVQQDADEETLEYVQEDLNFDLVYSDDQSPATLIDFVFVPLTLERVWFMKG
jgi:hypothetical protein